MAFKFIFNLIKTYGVSKVEGATKEAEKDVECQVETEKYKPPIAGKSKTKIGSKKRSECEKKHSDEDRRKQKETTINQNRYSNASVHMSCKNSSKSEISFCTCNDFKTEKNQSKRTSDLEQIKKSAKKRRKIKKISSHHSGYSDTSVRTAYTKSSSTEIRFCTCDKYSTIKNRPKKQTALKQKNKSANERQRTKKISNPQSGCYDTSVHTACTSSSEIETSFSTCDEFKMKKTRSNKRTHLKKKKNAAKQRRKIKKISTIFSEYSDSSVNMTWENSSETDICTCGKEQQATPTTTKKKRKNLRKEAKRSPVLGMWDGCKRSRKKKRAKKCQKCRLSH